MFPSICRPSGLRFCLALLPWLALLQPGVAADDWPANTALAPPLQADAGTVAPPEDLILDPSQSPAELQSGMGTPGAMLWPTAPAPFQRVVSSFTWLLGNEPDQLGILDIDFRTATAFPCPTAASPLIITPGFGIHFFNGPDAPDLPAQVYDLLLDVSWRWPVTERFVVELGLTPGLFSDFEQSTSKAFRLLSRIIGVYAITPRLQLVFGGVFLNREDVIFLPALGLAWAPTDDLRLELMAPRPRFAWRTNVDPATGEESWWYIAGEWGGGSWAIERTSGLVDRVNYQDFRLLLGHEFKRNGEPWLWWEAGLVGGRRLTYDSGTPPFEPDGTLLVRGGVAF